MHHHPNMGSGNRNVDPEGITTRGDDDLHEIREALYVHLDRTLRATP